MEPAPLPSTHDAIGTNENERLRYHRPAVLTIPFGSTFLFVPPVLPGGKLAKTSHRIQVVVPDSVQPSLARVHQPRLRSQRSPFHVFSLCPPSPFSVLSLVARCCLARLPVVVWPPLRPCARKPLSSSSRIHSRRKTSK